MYWSPGAQVIKLTRLLPLLIHQLFLFLHSIRSCVLKCLEVYSNLLSNINFFICIFLFLFLCLSFLAKRTYWKLCYRGLSLCQPSELSLYVQPLSSGKLPILPLFNIHIYYFFQLWPFLGLLILIFDSI